MSSFLWLLLYLAPLLALTGAVFAWLGWKWRGKDLRQQVRELQSQIDEIQAHRSAGEIEQDTLRGKATSAEAATAAIREEFKNSQAEALRARAEVEKAHEFSQSLKSELARTIQELDVLRAERDQAAAALVTAHAEMERQRALALEQPAIAPSTAVQDVPPPDRTKRTRAAPKPKTTAARNATLQDTLAALEAQLTAHQAAITTLARERDDWQRRVTQLEAQPIADPAGLGLAYRSLAESEQRLQAARHEIERLQNQSSVLRGVQADAPTLASVPDDDLTRIKGIKNVISEQLRAHGIRTWRQIAEWNDDELRAFSELLAFKNRATREKWKEQARLLHESAHGLLL